MDNKMWLKITLINVLFLVSSLVFASEQNLSKNILTMSQSSETDMKMTNRMIFGLNVVTTFDDQRLSAEQIELIKKLHPAFIRLPPGQHANYYNWKNGKFSLPENLRGNLVKSGKRHVRNIPLLNLLSISKRLEVPVSYVINVNDSDDKINELLRYIRSNNYQVLYWELGNEVYLPVNKKLIGNESKYVKRAKDITSLIYKVFPQAEVGIVGAPARTGKGRRWNHIILNNGLRNIIVHDYIGIPKKMRIALAEERKVAKLPTAFKKAMAATKRENFSTIEGVEGKDLWVSEYGVMYMHTEFQNSLGHAIWLGRKIINLLNNKAVAMAAYWNANAGEFALVQRDSDGNAWPTAPYFSFLMASQVATKGGYNAKLSITGGQAGCLDAEAFYTKRKIMKSIFVVNTCPSNTKLQLAGNEELASASGIGGRLDTDVKNDLGSCVRQCPIKIRKWRVRQGVVTIPPYSVGKLVIK